MYIYNLYVVDVNILLVTAIVCTKQSKTQLNSAEFSLLPVVNMLS